ncbi:MAG: VIT1/CCC1 transporter family protein [Actinomycetia bacterium]|nr:VIT1/CCC1 transporter family protein [Actinomycetes bacterium]
MTEQSTPHIPPPDHHRDVTGGALRAGVFGAMDGLVSNFSLVAGVIGAGLASNHVILTGLAGLAAGAFSMAAGEYTSVISQAEATEAEIEKEKLEISRNPKGEALELAEIYEGYGMSPEIAHEAARQVTAHPEQSWRVHAREELGVDPDDLPSPYVAAISSFLAFTVGALIPLLPLFFGLNSIVAVALVSAVGLFASGALVARLTTRPMWFGGGRQLVLGLVAAAATYLFGTLVGGI